VIGSWLRAGIGRSRATGRSTLPSFLSATLAGALLLVGCGGTVIDAKKAREAVGEDVERKTGVEVRSVSCPSDVEIVPGDTFTCRVVAADGRTAEVELRIRNFEADVETVSIDPAGS
jgi:hypothetical protein